MWLERFGTIDQNIFFGFCAVVFVIVVLAITYFIVRICYCCCKHIPIPGYTLTSTLVMSTLFICVSVLFRGVQPRWSGGGDDQRSYTLSNVCQIFVPMIVLGYVMFASALFIKMWAAVIAYRFAKNVTEFIANFIHWVLVIIAGTLVIIWIASFTPNVFEEDIYSNSTTTTNETLFECRGWTEDGSRDIEQYAWRVTMSVYMAFCLLLAVVALPFHACESDLPIPKYALPDVVTTVVICVNSTCCVIAGLIVWYQYHPQPSGVTQRDWYWYQLEDNRKYAIIGSLQLWMIFVAVLATLISEVLTVRMLKLMSSSDMRSKPRPQKKHKSRDQFNAVNGGEKIQKASRNDDDEDDVDTDKEDGAAAAAAADGSRKKSRKKKRTHRRRVDSVLADTDKEPIVASTPTVSSISSSRMDMTTYSSQSDTMTKYDGGSSSNFNYNVNRNSSTDEGFYQDYRSETTTMTTSAADLRTNGDGGVEDENERMSRHHDTTADNVDNALRSDLEFTADGEVGVDQLYARVERQSTVPSGSSEQVELEINRSSSRTMDDWEMEDRNGIDVNEDVCGELNDPQQQQLMQFVDQSDTVVHDDMAFTAGYDDNDEAITAF